MKQQNELLKAEKSLKQSEIDLHKANIEHLQSLQAPAISRDLEQMTRTANRYAEEKQKQQKLEEQVKALGAESRAKTSNLVNEFYLLGVTKTCLVIDILLRSLDTSDFTFEQHMKIDDINQQIRRWRKEAQDGKVPEDFDSFDKALFEEARARGFRIGPPTKH